MSRETESSSSPNRTLRVRAFVAELEIVGVNPYVAVPEPVLEALFRQAGRRKGPIPICGAVNGAPYRQSLVRYRGAWRLYVNTSMLKDSPLRLGERIKVTVAHDPIGRARPVCPEFDRALEANPAAKAAFDALTPSRQLEIVRYIAALKSAESATGNVAEAAKCSSASIA